MNEPQHAAHSPSFDEHDDIIYPDAIPFLLVHLGCFAAIWTGVNATVIWMAVGLYFLRMFAITGGFHRYFAHKTYRTSRFFQFLLAFIGQMSAQRGMLWWASKHRDHHRHSDQIEDSHSPRQFGLFFAHLGWIFAAKRGVADYSNVKDLQKFPELVWLEKYCHVPAIFLASICYLAAGWPGLVVGFLWSTVALYHGTFAINSFAHTWGKQRYFTGDDSRNNFFLALITMGEGWHNNHHYYMVSTRQGFFWWEIDVTYWILKGLSKLRIVSDLHEPTATVLRGERRLSRERIEQAAELVVPLIRAGVPARDAAMRIVGNSPSAEDVASRAQAMAGPTHALVAPASAPKTPVLADPAA
ncbi:MAG: acyl-CoA desaturase [Fimbriimonadaceae bacterium]